MNELDTQQAMQPSSKGNGHEAVPRHWFCVGVAPSGEMFKKDADSPTDLLEIIGRSAIAWVDYWAHDLEKEALPAAMQMGFSDLLASSLTGESFLNYQDFDTEMGMRLPSIQVVEFEVKSFPLLVLLRKNLLLTVHPLNVDRRFSRLRRYSDTVLRKIPLETSDEDKLTLLLMRIIDENNDRNFEDLRRIEERGDVLNESLIDPQTPRSKLGPQIYQMKHALITYLNSLWETVDVLHTLRYGDAELITNDQRLLDKIGILAEDVNRHIGLSEHMSEVLASGLEVLQSIYNNQLQVFNNRMALIMTYLTILGTAVLVPNTLATIFGNSAFGMVAKDRGWYLTMLAASTIAATALAYWWVRRTGWIPKKME